MSPSQVFRPLPPDAIDCRFWFLVFDTVSCFGAWQGKHQQEMHLMNERFH